MKTAVIDVGHVGPVTAACLARWGHDVVGMDDDQRKIASLEGGEVPFFEAGLQELVDEGVASGRLRLTSDVRQALDMRMRHLVLGKLRGELWHLQEKVVAVLGAAFKPGTDDLREAPALHLARQLAAEGATVRIWDPVALGAVKEAHPEFEAVEDLETAITDAHAVVVATEWEQIRALTPGRLLELLAYPIVVDGRNVFDPSEMVHAGLHHHAVGRA